MIVTASVLRGDGVVLLMTLAPAPVDPSDSRLMDREQWALTDDVGTTYQIVDMSMTGNTIASVAALTWAPAAPQTASELRWRFGGGPDHLIEFRTIHVAQART